MGKRRDPMDVAWARIEVADKQIGRAMINLEQAKAAFEAEARRTWRTWKRDGDGPDNSDHIEAIRLADEAVSARNELCDASDLIGVIKNSSLRPGAEQDNEGGDDAAL